MTAISHDVFASFLVRASRSSQCISITYRGICPQLPRQQRHRSSQRQHLLPQRNRRHASTASSPKPKKPQNNQPPPPPTHSRISQIPLPTGAKSESFTPKPLTRPLGLSYPPAPSQNSGLDERSLRKRHADLTNYDRHLIRRNELKSEFSKPYFRDWTMMKHAKGKSFVSNERLFKGEKAGYFPNLWGHTLERRGKGDNWMPKLGWNTTQVLQGRVTILTLFSGLWAERQVKSFVDDNLELMDLIGEKQDKNGSPQIVRVNVEDGWMRRMIVKLFMWRLRGQFQEEDWGKYFLVSKSLASDEIRDAIGFLNGKVGYVYLLDSHCRIRWAGSGNAEDEERASLVNCLQRLLEETRREAEGEKHSVSVTETKEPAQKKESAEPAIALE